MSSRYERRRGSAGGAVLLLIAAAALVVAILAICTDIFSGKKAPDKDTDDPPVTQTDGENTGDGTQSGDGQDTTGDTDNTDADNAGDGKSDVTTTKPASSNVITTSDKPYQSGGVYVVGSAGNVQLWGLAGGEVPVHGQRRGGQSQRREPGVRHGHPPVQRHHAAG